ncbi:MAG TPA: hypothetical protein VD789_09630, partial [Thermomicrobiales bacterium]|nr:hypothetical protein [Thermomicrobiales bacterium]
MPDHTASPHVSPEERLDRWLDALNEPGRVTPPAPPDEIEEIAAIALEYRRVLGATSPIATDRTVKPERNGAMSRPIPLASPNGTWTRIERRERPTGWMDRISQGLATAMVVALLIALVGGVYLRAFGLPTGSGDPTRAPGLAASPEATSDGTLSCGAPGYRPVLQGEGDQGTLAGIDLGSAPIVIGEDEITT